MSIAFKEESMQYFLVFSVAVFATSYSPQLPHGIFLLFFSLAAMYSCYRRYFIFACFFLGITVGFIRGQLLVNQQLPAALEGIPIELVGTIEGLPTKESRRQRFWLRVESVSSNSADHLLGKKVQLSWYSHQKGGVSAPLISPGERWQLTVKLRRPRGFVNPAGMDYQAYLLRQEIGATGYVVNAYSPQLLEHSCRRVLIDCLRWHIRQSLHLLLLNTHGDAPSTTLGAIVALSVGDTRWIAHQQWEQLKNTGTVHLLAISGLHIGLAAGIGFVIGRWMMRIMGLWMPFSFAMRFLPIASSLLFSSAYSLLAGMSLPTQRAFIMVLLYQLSVLFFYRLSPWLLLSIALSGVAVIDPLAVYSVGFWLSFLAVGVLLYGFLHSNHLSSNNLYNTKITRITAYCLQSIKAQWIVTIGLVIPSFIVLQGISISSPLANVVAVPWVSLLIVPAIFLLLFLLLLQSVTGVTQILPSLIGGLYSGIDTLTSWLFQLLQYCDQHMLKFWFVNFPQPSTTVVILAVLAAICVLAPKGLPCRYKSLILLLPLFLPLINKPAFRATLLDVGQGTAVVIETENHRLVYDTGRMFGERFNAGEHIIAPYLRTLGGNAIDTLIVSHADADHAGGVEGLLKTIHVNTLLSGQPHKLKRSSLKRSPVSKPCYQGQKWEWDKVQFEILWPSRDYLSSIPSSTVKSNNLSCVLLMTYYNKRVLLTGDIETSIEQQLLALPELSTAVDIMLVPHHGSKTSSSISWLTSLSPDVAVVTAGYNNQYNHPHPNIVQAYKKTGAELMNTAVLGAVRLTLDDEHSQWRIERWREDKKRYWYDADFMR